MLVASYILASSPAGDAGSLLPQTTLPQLTVRPVTRISARGTLRGYARQQRGQLGGVLPPHNRRGEQMFSFDLPFEEVEIVLGTETIPVTATGIAHCIGDWDGASVVDIWLTFSNGKEHRQRMLDRDNPIELALFRMLAASVERACQNRIDEIIDERCGEAMRKANALDRQFHGARL